MKRVIIRPGSVAAGIMRVPRLLLAVFIIILFIQAVSFLSRHFFPDMTVAEWGSIQHGRWLNFIVLREEEVLIPPLDGKVELLTEDGTKVTAGEAIAEVVSTDLARRLEGNWRKVLRAVSERLYNIDRELAEIEKDITYLNNQLSGVKSTSARRGTLKNLHEIKNRKEQLLSAKNEVIKETEIRIGPRWRSEYRLVRSKRSGIFKVSCDGRENWGMDSFHEDISFFGKDRKPEYSHKPVGKVITGFKQILLCKIPEEIADCVPKEGARCRLVMGNKEYNVTFIGITKTKADGICWLLEDSSLKTNLIEKRQFKAYLIFRETHGVKIPHSALHVSDDNKSFIYTVSRGGKKRLDVEVIDKNREWAVVKKLPLGTPVYY